jgi:hypothetical protein
MKSRYDDSILENQRLQDRIDSMEFVRRNYNSSSRLSVSGGSSGYLPPTPSGRSGRAPSVSRFTSVERETDPSLPPPYKSREPSVSRRTSRDYSNDRWGERRDSTTANTYGENDSKTSNRRRPDRWSSVNSPNMNSSTYNFSSLPGRTYLHVMNTHDYIIWFAWFWKKIFQFTFVCFPFGTKIFYFYIEEFWITFIFALRVYLMADGKRMFELLWIISISFYQYLIILFIF